MNKRMPSGDHAGNFQLLRVVATGAATLCLATTALAQTRSDVAITASTAYDSNPFLAFGGDTDVASFRLELVPTLSRTDDRSSIRISGRVEHVEYLKRYNSAQNFSANVNATHRLTERLEAGAKLSVSSTVSTTDFNGSGARTDTQVPGDVPLPIVDDITLFGDRQRRYQVTVEGSLRYSPSEFDELSWSSVAQALRYKSPQLQDSDYASQRINYSHRLNDDITLGGSLDASVSNFKNSRIGDAKSISPQFSIGARLNPRLEAFASFGLAFTRTNTTLGRTTTTSFAGSGRLCYKGSLSNFCLNGQRQVLPSAIGGVRTQTSAGATYSRRLSERETVQLGGSYSIASAPLATAGAAGGDFASVRTYARYERQLDERLMLFASAGYSDSSDDLSIHRSNFQGALGITLKFGRGR